MRLRCWVREGCTFCRELRSGALVGLQAELCTTRRERFSVIPICSSSSKIDACTETHINRSTSKIDACTETHINRRYIAIKSHREPPVFARKGQNGVVLEETPGAEARISPLGPAAAVRASPSKNGAALAANVHAVRGPRPNGKMGCRGC